MPGWGVYRALNWGWVRHKSEFFSYSIYIWQQLVIDTKPGLGLEQVWWMGLWLLPLLILASISYYVIERPLMKLRTFYRPTTATVSGQPPAPK